MWPVGRSRFISNAALTAVLLDHNSPWHPRHHHHHHHQKKKKTNWRRRRRMFVYSSSSSSSSSSSPPLLSTSSSSSSSSSQFCHQVSLASVGQFAVRVLKELSTFHQWGSIENSAQCFFTVLKINLYLLKGQEWRVHDRIDILKSTTFLVLRLTLSAPFFTQSPPYFHRPRPSFGPLHPLLNNRFCKIPKISHGAYIFQRPLLRGLSTEFYGSLRI